METTHAVLAALKNTLVAEYGKQLQMFHQIAKPKQQALLDGYSDGVTAGIRHVTQMLSVKVNGCPSPRNDYAHVYAPLDDTCIHCAAVLPSRKRHPTA